MYQPSLGQTDFRLEPRMPIVEGVKSPLKTYSPLFKCEIQDWEVRQYWSDEDALAHFKTKLRNPLKYHLS